LGTLYISLIIVVLDQVTKLLVKGFSIPFLKINYYGMWQGQSIPIIGDFFRITFVENPGMAFGVDLGSSVKLAISLFSFVAGVGLIFYLYSIRNQNLNLRISIAMIIGGAFGNFIDRMFYGVFYSYAPFFYGKVVDFLDFNFFKFEILGRSYDRFPIFNIADSSVSIGVFLLLVFYKKYHKEAESKSKEENVPVENIEKKETNNAKYNIGEEVHI
jgi:signal peptidase II